MPDTFPMPTDAEFARVAEVIRDYWGQQGWQRPECRAEGIKRLITRRYPDFADRVQNVASLIVSVMPLLPTDGTLTEADYKAHLQADLRRLLNFLDGSVRQDLASRLVAECRPAFDDDQLAPPSGSPVN